MDGTGRCFEGLSLHLSCVGDTAKHSWCHEKTEAKGQQYKEFPGFGIQAKFFLGCVCPSDTNSDPWVSRQRKLQVYFQGRCAIISLA